MVDTTNDPLGIESLFKTWTKSMNELMGTSETDKTTSDFLSAFYQSPFLFPFQSFFQQDFFNIQSQDLKGSNFHWPFKSGSFTGDADAEKAKGHRKDMMAIMMNAMKNWQTLAGAMSSPESISAIFKGVSTMPEMMLDLTQSTIAGLTEIHQKMAENVVRMGESVKAYNFDNIDENIFQAWADIYEKEFRKFLRIPQLGLTREYQEKFNDMVDKLNIFQANIAEFLRMLSLPFQRSALVMQEEVQALAEKGQLSEDPQFYYQMWLKILEGHFMTLFQTPEYIESLNTTVASMSEFTSSRDCVLEDMLRNLPVACRTEIDDVAKELHQLKKEMRNLKKKISGGKI